MTIDKGACAIGRLSRPTIASASPRPQLDFAAGESDPMITQLGAMVADVLTRLRTARSTATAALVAVGLCLNVWGQAIPPHLLAEVDPQVLERAQSGQFPMEVIVSLDASEVLNRAGHRRREKGLPHADKEIGDQMGREYELLKRSVFPGGRHGDASVVRTVPNMPISLLSVPDMNALQRLIDNPRVRGVSTADKVFYSR